MSKKKGSLSLPFTTAKLDIWLFASAVFLTLFGLLMVYNSSIVIAQRDFGNQYHYLRDQIVWVTLGFFMMGFLSFVDYRIWQKLALPLLIGTLILLFAVFLPGIGVHASGASRWINFGVFILQPAELAKLTLIIYLAAWFAKKEKGRLLAFLLLIGLVLFLVMLEPDMGTSVILAGTAFMLYFLSGAAIWHFSLFVPVAIVGFLALIKLAPYRLARLTTFLDSDKDPLGASYHVRQTLFALGNGGLFGVGLGKSFQKYGFLPESTTDSIFAVIAEEIGFLGALLIIFVLFCVVLRAFVIARRAKDPFAKLLAGGIASYLALQMIVNLSAQVILLPFTGVPLPFLSYGGSSLIITLSAVGILLSISRSNA